MNLPSGILPAVRTMKDFDKALVAKSETMVLLETRLSQLKNLVEYAHRSDKKIIIHFDLIQGLKTDEYGMEYILREIKPDGIISTRGNVIGLAKKQQILAIQRIFLLDSLAIEHNRALIERIKPDCIEVLPGLIPRFIKTFSQKTYTPIIAGGLITERKEVDEALEAGAIAVSTSKTDLW
ncbi:glycerol-3-phosphate responsive antiterminator [Virgibacillus necropolis]|uniref:Glycerol uptake operon antiterminator regulatory protein n=1 Tax=Virgibacillus necropolis TaxID=163877 RepID=A0A221MAU2_9BACI|nr:glycerol-3-phosphate responsive antiterminator [Virgibacillus necropolis]ASN04753.1 glycerol-3-phosphate responsive antiterminator GlpP [Virgibacillus necropolis]